VNNFRAMPTGIISSSLPSKQLYYRLFALGVADCRRKSAAESLNKPNRRFLKAQSMTSAGLAMHAAGCLALIGVYAADVRAADTAAVPVFAGEVRRADVPTFLTGLGTVRAFNSVVLTSRVDGQIVKINFDEGQEVHAGDVLVEIDPQPFAAALAQAEATKQKDMAMLGNAKLDLERAQKLVGNGSGTTQQLDTTRAQVAQLEASTKSDQAAIEAAQTQLNYCKIRSPIDGRTGTRQIDAGNIVRASSSNGIVTINQIRPISVDFDLRADSLPQIRARMKSENLAVSALDREDHPIAEGILRVIDNQVNVATGTIRYKATFENADESLWPGEFVTVQVRLQVRAAAITVPTTAVLRGPEGTYAFVIDSAKIVRKRPIDVDFMDKNVAVIGHGLQPGELVVTEGQYRIQSGTSVKIVPQNQQPATEKGS
jgi:membrane fusion protein, multidrug efflux system